MEGARRSAAAQQAGQAEISDWGVVWCERVLAGGLLVLRSTRARSWRGVCGRQAVVAAQFAKWRGEAASQHCGLVEYNLHGVRLLGRVEADS